MSNDTKCVSGHPVLFLILIILFVFFALSGWWKIQMTLILLPKNAAERRKRKTRTETGEKRETDNENIIDRDGKEQV